MKKVHDPRQFEQRWDGPYPIERVHVNGNVTIALKPGVLERINIRQVKPYFEPELDQNITEAAIGSLFLLTEGKNDAGSRDTKGLLFTRIADIKKNHGQDDSAKYLARPQSWHDNSCQNDRPQSCLVTLSSVHS